MKQKSGPKSAAKVILHPGAASPCASANAWTNSIDWLLLDVARLPFKYSKKIGNKWPRISPGFTGE
jgi:hypothetical protein